MAGEVSKKELGFILLQAMCAAKNIRAQRDRLLQLQRQLLQITGGDAPAGDAAARLGKIASGLVDVYFAGLGAGTHYLTVCLTKAAENGARLALNLAFFAMPDEQLYDALLSQRLPARPTTQTEAFSRIEAAIYATKLPKEHHLHRCLEHLGVIARPDTAEPTQEDTVTAATEDLAKISLSDLDASVTEPPPEQASSQTALPAPALSLEQALSYLDRACTLVSLAVKHTDLAVTVLSSFLDPKEVAESKEMAEDWAYISEEGAYPSE